MANEIALAKQPPEATDADAYQAFHAVLSSNARGRAFLAEYARRNRHADTEMLLAALERLEALVRAHMTPAAGIRGELRALLETIRSARPQIDARALPARAAKLAGLLNLLERRIDEIAKTNAEPAAPPADTPAIPAIPEQLAGDAGRARLAVVAPPDEPELPIPSPSAQPPAIALVPETNMTSAAVMPEVNVLDIALPAPAAETTVSTALAAAPPSEALALIMALSEEERIALFT